MRKRFLILSAILHAVVFGITAIVTQVQLSSYVPISAANSVPFISVGSKSDGDDEEPIERTLKITNIAPVEQKRSVSAEGEYSPAGIMQEVPVALAPIRPAYPDYARRTGLEGTVTAELFIDAAGTVRKVNIIRSPHETLSTAAENALRATPFSPARINGETRNVRMRINVRFTLE
ncbi:MAG: energy transducer TonB [Spirochaetes bacterium]|nr:energy transducer TonB [Spirochaetota bacterium]